MHKKAREIVEKIRTGRDNWDLFRLVNLRNTDRLTREKMLSQEYIFNLAEKVQRALAAAKEKYMAELGPGCKPEVASKLFDRCVEIRMPLYSGIMLEMASREVKEAVR